MLSFKLMKAAFIDLFIFYLFCQCFSATILLQILVHSVFPFLSLPCFSLTLPSLTFFPFSFKTFPYIVPGYTCSPLLLCLLLPSPLCRGAINSFLKKSNGYFLFPGIAHTNISSATVFTQYFLNIRLFHLCLQLLPHFSLTIAFLTFSLSISQQSLTFHLL